MMVRGDRWLDKVCELFCLLVLGTEPGPHTVPEIASCLFSFLPRLTWNCGPLTFSQVLELTICATMPNLAPVVLNC